MSLLLPENPPRPIDWERGSQNLAAWEHFINDSAPGTVPLPGGGTIPNLQQLLAAISTSGGLLFDQTVMPGGAGPFLFMHSRNGGLLLVVGDGTLQSSGYTADNEEINFTYDTAVFTSLRFIYTYLPD